MRSLQYSSTALWENATLAIGTHRRIVEVGFCDRFSLQWRKGAAGVAAITLFTTAAEEKVLQDRDPATNLWWRPQEGLEFDVQPIAGVGASRVLSVSAFGFSFVLIDINVTTPIDDFTLYVLRDQEVN